MTSQNPYRLPRHILPKHYAIELEPDLAAGSFDGQVVIDLEVVTETDTIVLNAVELEIEEVRVEQSDSVSASSILMDEDLERAEFSLPIVLQPGPARLFCSFKGILNDKLRGFYRSTWNDDAGNEHVIAGVLGGKFRVYIDPYSSNVSDNQYYVAGYKGSSPYDAGLFYCPYVPLQMVRAVGQDSFQPKIGFKTRYGVVANPFAEGTSVGAGALTVNSNRYYRRVTVNNLM